MVNHAESHRTKNKIAFISVNWIGPRASTEHWLSITVPFLSLQRQVICQDQSEATLWCRSQTILMWCAMYHVPNSDLSKKEHVRLQIEKSEASNADSSKSSKENYRILRLMSRETSLGSFPSLGFFQLLTREPRSNSGKKRKMVLVGWMFPQICSPSNSQSLYIYYLPKKRGDLQV